MRLSNRFEKHMVAAAAVAMGAAAAANAAVVYSGVINFVCAVDSSGCYINVQTNVLSNGPGGDAPGWDLNIFKPSTGSGMGFRSSSFGLVSSSTTSTANKLATGTAIGASSTFSASSSSVTFGAAAGNWQYGSENLVGFKFKTADATTHYGWMRFLMGAAGSSGTSATRTVVDYGYESTAATSILAGAGIVPAPGALALLGVAGLVGARRRRA
ncbi:MAG: hypothetical protein RIR77_730 [Planctomycetota bacterium]|jgi:hypothetical protein